MTAINITRSPGTMAIDSSVGEVNWVNPDNAKSSDDTYAVATFVDGDWDDESYYLKATNFGFSIPTGATINGISVDVEVKCEDDGGEMWFGMLTRKSRIIKGGVIGDTDVAGDLVEWKEIERTLTIGSDSELWDETWTSADINSSTFGFTITCSPNKGDYPNIAYVDSITMKVYYNNSISPFPSFYQ